MTSIGKRCATLYTRLLGYLPAGFRDEFGVEMEQVFAQRAQNAKKRGRWAIARAFLDELVVYPGLWLLAYRRERRVPRMSDSRPNPAADRPSPWGAVLAAILPLAGYPLAVLMAKTLRRLSQGTVLDGPVRVLWTSVIQGGPIPLLFYMFLLGGLLVAWRKGFPRWSFPYLGWLLVIVLFALGVSGRNAPPWWLSWGPLLGALLLAVLLGRSLAPLRTLWRSLLQDWTQVSLALFGLLEFIVLACFDEMPGPRGAKLFWQWVSSATLVASVAWYMRCTRTLGRIVALLGGAAAGVTCSMVPIGYYWRNYPKPYYSPSPSGSEGMLTLAFLAVAVLCLLIPGAISALLRRFSPERSTG